YFCGGNDSYTTSTRWLVAPLDASGAVAFGPAGAVPWQLSASVAGDAVTRTLDRGDGAPVSFFATRAAPRTLAGLFEVMAPCGQVGVIVQQAAGDAAIVQGACINADPTVPIVQVSPLGPVMPRGDGTLAVVPTGADTAFVHAAAPPVD